METRAIYHVDYVNPNDTTGSCRVVARSHEEAREIVEADDKAAIRCSLIGDISNPAERQTHPLGILKEGDA